MKYALWIAGGILVIFVATTAVLRVPDISPHHPRDRPIDPLPRSAPIRATFVGTSLTAGYSWPEQIETCTGGRILTASVAKAGASSNWMTSQLSAIISTAPDVVFIEFSINDADIRHGITRSRSERNHRWLIHELRKQAPGIRIVLMTMNSAYGLRRLLRPFLPGYYGLYSDLARSLDVGMLDLYTRWLRLSKDARNQPDGLHPADDNASEVILPALAAYLGIPCTERPGL